MPALMMNRRWTQPMQAFVQERLDCDFEYEYDRSIAILYGDLAVIKEFIEKCEHMNSTDLSPEA